MEIKGNAQVIERYDTSTPSPYQISPKIQELKNFVIICRNILGSDIPSLCYNLDNITDYNVTEKGSKIINELLFKAYRKAIDNNNYFDIAALTIRNFFMVRKYIRI